jgi:hypothetical protein
MDQSVWQARKAAQDSWSGPPLPSRGVYLKLVFVRSGCRSAILPQVLAIRLEILLVLVDVLLIFVAVLAVLLQIFLVRLHVSDVLVADSTIALQIFDVAATRSVKQP